jgi:hypothetical protein
MPPIIPGRMTAERRDPFVVFLIGVRINRPLRVDKWWPVLTAMPRMLRELEADPGLGFLGSHIWFGRTVLVLQYWDSFDRLEAYAAWREFNRRIGASGDVGIWHETYLVQPGAHESIYVNMPPFGLGKVASVHPAEGARQQARQRLRRDGPGLTQ